MLKYFQAALLLLICTVQCGCSTANKRYQNIVSQNVSFPSDVTIENVPIFVQDEHECGPAALAMVIAWGGEDGISPEQISPDLFTPSKKGSFQYDLISAARRNGKIAYVIPPNPEALFSELAAGYPVIILQNLGLSWIPRWHYSVVVGYDSTNEQFILHSGQKSVQKISFTPFDNTWARSGYWAVVVLPPEKLPSTAESKQFLESIHSLEEAGKLEESIKAYDAARNRWPSEASFLLGQATAYYQRGELLKSEKLFKEGSRKFPNSQALLNNYAEVLAKRGKLKEALGIAQKAVGLSGPFHEISQRTLNSIQDRINKSRSQVL
ncbi:MAG: PA2778 family cysteine peptidase [bacterium]|mgnify:CR=1 FL=1|nr:PA2778 family cysteine peptidase [bacterium]